MNFTSTDRPADYVQKLEAAARALHDASFGRSITSDSHSLARIAHDVACQAIVAAKREIRESAPLKLNLCHWVDSAGKAKVDVACDICLDAICTDVTYNRTVVIGDEDRREDDACDYCGKGAEDAPEDEPRPAPPPFVEPTLRAIEALAADIRRVVGTI